MPIYNLTPTNPFDYDFVPLWKTYREGSDERGYFAQQVYWGPFEDRLDFIYAMLGQSFNSGGWNRTIPFQVPGTGAYALEGVVLPGDGIVKDEANLVIAKDDIAYVQITFRVPMFPFQRGANDDDNSFGVTTEELDALLWAEQEIDGDMDIFTIPGTNAYWWSSDKPVATPCSLMVFTQVMHIFFHMYPVLPATLVRAYINKLNADTFLGCPRGTVMFCKPKTRRQFDSNGRVTQQAGFTFRFREHDWNKEPVIAKKLKGDGFAYAGHWDYVVFETGAPNPSTTDTGPWRYDYADFQKLIEFTLP